MKEPGYTPFKHETMDALLSGSFTASEIKLVLFVLRMTEGFQRDSADIGAAMFRKGVFKRDGTQIVAGTGLCRRVIFGSLETLIQRQVLRVISRGSWQKTANVYTVNPSGYWTSAQDSTSARRSTSQNIDKNTTPPSDSDSTRLVHARTLPSAQDSTTLVQTPRLKPTTYINPRESSIENPIEIRENQVKEKNEKELTNEGVAPPQTPAPTGGNVSLNEKKRENGEPDLDAQWQSIINNIPEEFKTDPAVSALKTGLLKARTDHTLHIWLPGKFFKDRLETPMAKELVRTVLELTTGEVLDVEYSAPAPKVETGRVKGR